MALSSDPLDVASEQEQAQRDAAIRSASANTVLLKACGACLNCGEPLEGELRFCDKDCLTDFERREEPARVSW